MVSPTVPLLLWTLYARCASAQTSSILSVPPVPISLVTQITPVADTSTASLSSTLSAARNATFTSSSLSSSTTPEVIGITGTPAPSASSNATSTTADRPRPTVNTTPCNGHPEFCNRRFSNVSMVVAHNSPFVKEHNAASNQALPVLTQLEDGIRGLQFETQRPNGTGPIRLCHTSCDLLDSGTLESYLATVKGWLDENPYEVIAIMMGNNNGHDTRNTATDYIAPFRDSGILEYIWTPSAPNLNLNEWPTLAEMILTNERVVAMLDYGADQTAVPWLISEFNYMWETPFSPTDSAFPCTQQRPPDQAEDVSRNRMYMANHNLNIEINFAGMSILVPAYGMLNDINAVAGNASLGENVAGCKDMWGRPPNWLLVDYYNFGNFNGSVFQVAATANGVEYDRDSCCGSLRKNGAVALKSGGSLAAVFLVALFLV